MKIPHLLKNFLRTFSLSLAFGSLAILPTACAHSDMPALKSAVDPQFQPVGERRAQAIIDQVNMKDAELKALLHRYVLNFIIETKNINEGMDASEEVKRPLLEKARATLYSGLDATHLNDANRLIVMNGLSSNYYNINYDAFVDLVPELTDAQKAYIHEQLADVCHEAILLNSGREKGELFIDRRGRINNFLSKEGYDLKALSVERNARIRAGQ